MNRRAASRQTVPFANGFSLGLATAGHRFPGIGEVRYGPTPLRYPDVPWIVYAASETGVGF